MQRLNLKLERLADSNRRSQLGNRVFSIQSEETKAHRQMDEQLGRFAGA